jgi:hypothetical protein
VNLTVSGKLTKDQITRQMLDSATARNWSPLQIEQVRQAIESAAEAIWKVEEFPVETDMEPADLRVIFERNWKRWQRR